MRTLPVSLRRVLTATIVTSVLLPVHLGPPPVALAAPPAVTSVAPTVTRLTGSTRASAAARLSREGWASGRAVAVLVPSNSAIYTAIASPLAASLKAPVLVADSRIPLSTSHELARLKVKSVYVVGGTKLIKPAVTRALARRHIAVKRLAGRDVYSTARVVAVRVRALSKSRTVVIASASGTYARVAAFEAARTRSPLLLSKGSRLPSSTKAAIKRLRPTFSIVVGPKSSLPNSILRELKSMKAKPTRVSGSAAHIAVDMAERARQSGTPLTRVLVVGTSSVSDAPGVAALAARLNAPVLLTASSSASSIPAAFISSHRSSIRELVVCATNSAVGQAAVSGLVAAATTTISTKAEVLNTDELQAISSVTDSTVVFGESVSGIAVGDTIVGTPTEHAPYGLLRKVTAVSTTGGSTVLSTVDGALDDVIKQGSIDYTGAVTFPSGAASAARTVDGGIPTYVRDGVEVVVSGPVNGEVVSTTLSLALDTVIYDEDNDQSTTNDQVLMNGKVSLSPSIDMHAKIDNYNLEELVFQTSATEKLDVTLSSAVKASLGNKVKLYSQPLSTIVIWAGPVPVTLTPVVSVYAGADGSVSVGVSAGAVQTASYTAGVRCANGAWTPISHQESTFSCSPPTLSASAEAKAYSQAEIALMLYGSAGPTASIELYTKASADPASDQLWEIRVGAKASAGAKLEVMSHLIADWSTSLFDWSTVVASKFKPGITPVEFADAGLESAVRDALGKPSGAITRADMSLLTSLAAENRGITSLQGLEYASGLVTLYVPGNHISDLSPLSGLSQLQFLSIYSNQIGNLTPLSGLSQLQYLSLYSNQISDLTPLADLAQLQYLYLGNNQISDLTPLSGLTQLVWLELSSNPTSDFSPIAGLTQLETLNLYAMQITDLSQLSGLTQLKELGLGTNQISDLTPLSGLTQLQFLYLGTNQISDLSPLSGLTQLQWLYLHDNLVSDLSPLSGLVQMRQLDLRRNSLDLSAGSGAMSVIALLQAQGTTVTY